MPGGPISRCSRLGSDRSDHDRSALTASSQMICSTVIPGRSPAAVRVGLFRVLFAAAAAVGIEGGRAADRSDHVARQVSPGGNDRPPTVRTATWVSVTAGAYAADEPIIPWVTTVRNGFDWASSHQVTAALVRLCRADTTARAHRGASESAVATSTTRAIRQPGHTGHRQPFQPHPQLQVSESPGRLMSTTRRPADQASPAQARMPHYDGDARTSSPLSDYHPPMSTL